LGARVICPTKKAIADGLSVWENAKGCVELGPSRPKAQDVWKREKEEEVSSLKLKN
jgi:hypothetical protein